MRGRLELSIRSLPNVVACSITSEDLFVLAAPTADRAKVEAAVRALVDSDGGNYVVRVMGGTEPVTVAITEPSLRRWSLAAGSAAAALMLAVSSMGSIGSKTPATDQAAPPTRVYDVELPQLRRAAPARIGRAQPQRAPRVTQRPTTSTDGRVPAVDLKPAINIKPDIAPPVIKTVDVVGTAGAAAVGCHLRPPRGTPRALLTAQGNGPASHSRSALLVSRASCERGRA